MSDEAPAPRPATWSRRLLEAWPWAALSTLLLGLLWPQLTRPGVLLTSGLRQDGATTALVFVQAARALAQGRLAVPERAFGLSFPCEGGTVGVPAVVDAWLVAPLSLLLPWPQLFTGQQAAFLGMQGLGAACLARALGARGLGLLLAGVIGLTCLPLWHELQQGRLNGAGSGLALLALATFVGLARRAAERAPRGTLLAWTLLAALAGAAVLTTFPPFAIMVAPAGLGMLLAAGGTAPRRAGAAVLAALALGLLLSLPTLSAALGQVRGDQVIYNHEACSGGRLLCLWDDGHAYGRTLLQLGRHSPAPLLAVTTVGVGAWLLAPLALLPRATRPAALLGLPTILLLCLVSLGPCPMWLPAARRVAADALLSPLHGPLQDAWCLLSDLHRLERPAMVAVGLAGALAGAGLTALARGRGPGARAALGLLALGCIAQVLSLQVHALEEPDVYQHATRSVVGEHLSGEPALVAAALPFDEEYQFVTALVAPQHEWVNATRPYIQLDPEPIQPFLRWLWREGMLLDPAPAPTAADIPAAGVDRVYLDPTRCARSRQAYDVPGCEARLLASLTAVLGPPDETFEGVRAWHLRPAEGAPAERGCTVPGPPPGR